VSYFLYTQRSNTYIRIFQVQVTASICPDVISQPHQHEYTVQRQNQSSHGARVGPRPQPQAAAKPASDSVCKRVESSQMWLVNVD
jgi:hypothetical protein